MKAVYLDLFTIMTQGFKYLNVVTHQDFTVGRSIESFSNVLASSIL